MSLRNYRVECEAEVDLVDAVESLTDKEREELHQRLMKTASQDDLSLPEKARRLALAIERCDGTSAADLLHQLCMDLAGAPVMREIHIGSAPWERTGVAA